MCESRYQGIYFFFLCDIMQCRRVYMKRTNTFVTMGANGLVSGREENDFYATEPKATELLLEKETFNKNILEPCAGMGHIRDVLVSHGYSVTATDLIYRGVDDIKQEDVLY